MSPLTYFPDAKSVIAVAMRIPRGTYRGIEEGTHWHNYTFYSYNKLNSLFRPIKSYELCCFIEDHGWEAVAHYPAVPEGKPLPRANRSRPARFRPTSCAACASSQQAADWAKSDFQRFSSRRNSARACGWD